MSRFSEIKQVATAVFVIKVALILASARGRPLAPTWHTKGSEILGN